MLLLLLLNEFHKLYFFKNSRTVHSDHIASAFLIQRQTVNHIAQGMHIVNVRTFAVYLDEPLMNPD